LNVINGIRAVVEGKEPDAQFMVVITLILLVFNISESSLVRPGAWWVLVIVAAMSFAKIGKERRPVLERRYTRFQRHTPFGSPGTGRQTSTS
jgi:hypothetical protein